MRFPFTAAKPSASSTSMPSITGKIGAGLIAIGGGVSATGAVADAGAGRIETGAVCVGAGVGGAGGWLALQPASPSSAAKAERQPGNWEMRTEPGIIARHGSHVWIGRASFGAVSGEVSGGLRPELNA